MVQKHLNILFAMDKLGKEGKCKAHPRTGHEGTEGDYRYSYTLSLTSTLEEGESTTPRPGRFTRGRGPEPIVQKDRWTPQDQSGLVWKILPPPGFDSQTVQLIASSISTTLSHPTEKEGSWQQLCHFHFYYCL